MATTIASPAPVAASTPAPVAAPSAPVPASSPVVAPAAAPASSAQPTFGSGGVTTHVDPNKFPIREDFAAAVLQEKLDAIPAAVDEPAPVVEEAPIVAAAPEVPTDVPEVTAPDATPEVAEAKPEVPEFDFNPPAVMTPEVLTKMIADVPAFGELLEANPALKGQLYKTTREAAELRPYKEIFPDLETAKSIVGEVRSFHDVRDVFMGSTTKEGTQAALRKIAEMSHVRDENGNPVLHDGKPVVGDDFFGFVSHVAALELETRASEVRERLEADQYHNDPRIKALAKTDFAAAQAEVTAAYERDQKLLESYSAITQAGSEKGKPELTPELQRKAQELDERERTLMAKEQGGKNQSRQEFERGIQKEAETRIANLINSAIAHSEKNGAPIQPFLKEVLPQQIAAKLVARLSSIPGYNFEMKSLQALPPGDNSRQRRLAAVDRHMQEHAPDIIREVFTSAGIQTAITAKARAEKVKEQTEVTKRTEIPGSRGLPYGGQPMTSAQAYDAAQAEWQKANPSSPFGNGERASILPRVLQLMGVSA